MSGSMPPLDGRLLESLRAEGPAPADVRDRVRGRLAAVIPAMAPAAVGPHAATPMRSAWGRLGTWGTNGISIAAFVVGGVAGAALFASLSHPPASRVVYVDRPVFTSAPAPTVAPAAPAVQPAVVAATPAHGSPPPINAALAVASPAPVAQAAPSQAQSSPHPSRLAEERKLLDDARSGLLQGEPQLAVDRLEMHRALFPDGMLAEEREAMAVEALVRAGRVGEARERAAAFRAHSPQSLFSPTVEAVVSPAP